LDPKTPQVEARILGHIAGMHVVSQSWLLAIRYYEAAVEAASSVKDLLQLAKMHHGLGLAYRWIGQPTTARQHYDKALALYSIEADESSIYRVENDLGYLLLQEGQLDSAEQHLLKALAGSSEVNMDRRGRGYILASLGEVKLRRGRPAEARSYFKDSLDEGESSGERIVQAEAHVRLGQLEEREGNQRLCDDHLETAVRMLEGLNMPERLRDAHMDYAELLEARQDIAAALQHWKRAAEIGKAAALGIKLTRAASSREFEESLA
jgi:tetratricopeptide (TPR) repeat protein